MYSLVNFFPIRDKQVSVAQLMQLIYISSRAKTNKLKKI